MAFAAACKKAYLREEKWDFQHPLLLNTSTEELHWHLKQLTEEEIECEEPWLILTIALCSISTWGKMAMAIPWLGRYSRRKGIGHHVAHYFSENTPVQMNPGVSPMYAFSRAINGRLHGLRAYFPVDACGPGDEKFPCEIAPDSLTAEISMSVWDRGHSVRSNIGFTWFNYSHCTGKMILSLHWDERPLKGQVQTITIDARNTFECPVCAHTGATVKLSLKGSLFEWFQMCSSCYYIAPMLDVLEKSKVQEHLGVITLETIGLDADLFPRTPCEAIRTLEIIQQRIVDSRERMNPNHVLFARIAKRAASPLLADCVPSEEKKLKN